MKLLYSTTSPYSAKVHMAIRYLGIDVDAVKVNTTTAPAELVEQNPLGKIPTIVTADGDAVYDSRAIMQFLDQEYGRKLYPHKKKKRAEALVLEALCDGITDCLVASIYERRFRPEEKVHEPWLDWQWTKVQRGLDYLDKNLPKTPKTLHGGHFALAALVGYLQLRFEGRWEEGREDLTAWPVKFEKRFPEFPALKSQG
jgi:glutathione S-transferase